MRKLLIFILLPFQLLAQEKSNSVLFWNTLQTHCGKAFEGKIIAGAKEGDGFTGEKLVMHVRSCENNTIRIPFFVGDDKSRTWVFTMSTDKLIQLKHDHRHKDGSEDKITQYGGSNPNTGLPNIQFFPADKHTANLIPYASNNVWWVTIDETSFTYNLRRIGTDRLFSVKFDLTKEIETPSAPWGSED
ncbi:hypothetical protein H0I31_08815 [Tenacibaculum sp. AHE15PA]|uniref:hypothetical protein n=1 Tax=unclassified Tenacibaculum TaxID=2635139 RepID=UPI001C4F315F|nr:MULTISPECIES: hypothetical protein [unclassified Tenacibaculum]QXP74348.1 hypothetical protein H0I30_04155 [Tenacibaculum sp. AHE14PA]QXP75282.1 hypothetical protein H0I31_08815 [Tenacibaculum sp. AHE15PA]